MPHAPIYHRQRFRSPKHSTTKLMVGLLPLAPHHDSLQYLHHVHLMQWVQNWGVTLIHINIHKGVCQTHTTHISKCLSSHKQSLTSIYYFKYRDMLQE